MLNILSGEYAHTEHKKTVYVMGYIHVTKQTHCHTYW